MLRITEVRARNLLSFKEEAEPVRIGSRNVLIGGHGTGKGNLLRIFDLLGALPNDVDAWVRRTRSMGPLIRREPGEGDEAARKRSGEIRIRAEDAEQGDGLEYQAELRTKRDGLQVSNEVLVWNGREEDLEAAAGRSVLASRVDARTRPGVAAARTLLAGIRTYRAARFVPPWARAAAPDGLPDDFPTDGGSNLPCVLRRALADEEWRRMVKLLPWTGGGALTPEVAEERARGRTEPVWTIRIRSESGRGDLVQASDGMLRSLALLAATHPPCGASTICLDLPETGLHPDEVSAHLRLAAGREDRTQYVIRTHSGMLVSGQSETPRTLRITESVRGGTIVRSLPEKLLRELEEATPGERPDLFDLWASGELGGVS